MGQRGQCFEWASSLDYQGEDDYDDDDVGWTVFVMNAIEDSLGVNSPSWERKNLRWKEMLRWKRQKQVRFFSENSTDAGYLDVGHPGWKYRYAIYHYNICLWQVGIDLCNEGTKHQIKPSTECKGLHEPYDPGLRSQCIGQFVVFAFWNGGCCETEKESLRMYIQFSSSFSGMASSNCLVMELKKWISEMINGRGID